MPTEQTNIIPGDIIEGKVQGITTFGAFIELPGGLVGLVHISEIADTYVKDVKDFIKEGDAVSVKVLSIDGKKIGLSIKQASTPKVAPSVTGQPRFNRADNRRDNRGFNNPKKPETPVTLDDKISKFLKESDERMQPLKNRTETRRRNKYNS
ncbi:Nucleic acid-binding, OB-fold [Syntrophomonas zehnderi OL-4]|uniref:Nucleic acid-binding, OB-fold n=1 Tax=Syntrophomonas zehnderi OL-4 TaxID=690567 RepID=A0A0E4C7T0_9FIRM|nr:S1 RNA-binding domain-containing protein [Syntrophomonas zehnderi]CFX10618.1 Nucleic acid-binding, OB-fold [Syntrophomonas zehnderi OL-4]